MTEALVIDVGGTKTNVSFVNQTGSEIKILSSDIFPTPLKSEEAINQIKSACEKNYKNPSLMSLSLPGVWNEKGILLESFFLSNWLEYPFIETLAKVLKIQNYLWETDVICAAIGEYSVLEMSHSKSMLYINLGTGIGAALIKDGKPFKSSSALTLRMQKLILPFHNEFYSGVELISGGTLLETSQYDSIERLYKDHKIATVEAVDIISRAQVQLSAWIMNLFYLFAPDVIVLGGGLTYDWEVLAEGAVDIVNEELKNKLLILPSKLKEMAPIYGAYINLHSKKPIKQR